MAKPTFLDYFLRNAIPGQMTKHEKADEVVRAHVLWSIGAGFVPVPIVDIAAVTTVQVNMIGQISKIYRVQYQLGEIKSIISALAGSTLARIGASFVKAIPIVGSVVGGVSMAVLSGATTYALGQVFISHFERGGTFADFDINAYRDAYEDFFAEGKKVAREMEQEKGEKSGDAFMKLEKLSQLHERGIISDEEYERKKAEILSEL
ncbi:MAG: DUF697 domain-containing protein [Bacteroidota bacterium]